MDYAGRDFGDITCGGTAVAIIQQEPSAVDWVQDEDGSWRDSGTRHESILMAPPGRPIYHDEMVLIATCLSATPVPDHLSVTVFFGLDAPMETSWALLPVASVS